MPKLEGHRVSTRVEVHGFTCEIIHECGPSRMDNNFLMDWTRPNGSGSSTSVLEPYTFERIEEEIRSWLTYEKVDPEVSEAIVDEVMQEVLWLNGNEFTFKPNFLPDEKSD